MRQCHVSSADLIQPLFVREGEGVKEPIEAMPGQYRLSIDELVKMCRKVYQARIPAVLLFGISETRDANGSASWAEDGIVPRAVRAVKKEIPDLAVMTDVCLCGYTDHGHCGVILDGRVDNDATIELLARQAVNHARAGADIVAPSDMMDGRVAAIRSALDEADLTDTVIMSYAAKFASAFYGPFRHAADSAPAFGDRYQYQLDPANAREALREIELDIAEGADIVMVKPALAYLDLISEARKRFDVPLAAYNVSGEYAMIKAAAQQGWLDESAAVTEMLTAIKRAGADMILSYFSLQYVV